MPGGIQPPVEQWLKWPLPNYENPPERAHHVLICACVLGPISIAILFARLWVRIRLQRNAGLDDWLMLAAFPPMVAMTVLCPLVVSKYRFNRHVWDVEIPFFPTQRKFVMGIYCIFTLATGFIKLSALLFYRRLSSRVVSPAFRWTMRIMMIIVSVYTVAFVLVLAFACRPLAAFWEQVDFSKTLRPEGYHYSCINEGADVVANGIAATAQDFIVAFLPTLLCWKLQMPIRQKLALYGIFAISYTTVAIGAVRTYTTWRIYFESYDVTWIAYETFLASLLEMHIGAMCANAPALKVFFKQILNSQRLTRLVNSRSSKSRSNGSRNQASFTPRENSTRGGVSKTPGWVPIGLWKTSQSQSTSDGVSDLDVMIDKHGDIYELDGPPRDRDAKHAPEFSDTVMPTPFRGHHDVEMGAVRFEQRDSRISGLQALPPVLVAPAERRKYSNRETYLYPQSWLKRARSVSPARSQGGAN